jgi:hypothetical protein
VLQVCQRVERKTSAAIEDAPQIEAYVLAQNHDARGLDPRVTFQAPRDGVYIVRAFAFPSEPDSGIAFAGRDTFIYRLTLTSGGLLEYSLPLAISRGESGEVRLGGENLSANAVFVAPAVDVSAPEADYTTLFLPGIAGACELRRTPWPTLVATDAARSEAGQAVSLPADISGQLQKLEEAHTFHFTAKKGAKLNLAVESRAMFFPLDAVLSIADAEGKQLQSVDDAQKELDSKLAFSVPADGEYRAQVRDLHDRGGPRFVYRLTIEPPRAEYSLTLAADAFTLTPDKPLEIPITIDRRDGFSEAIAIAALGLPPGIAADAITSEAKGESATTVKLILRSTAEAALPWRGAIRIEGAATSGQRAALFPTKIPGTRPPAAIWLTAKKP